jgi:hypothetical protein
MRIEDYETPAIVDEYAPRPKASQIYAAAHRAGDTEPLTPITPAPATSPAARMPLAIGAIVLIVAMLGMATWQLSGPMQPMAIQPVPSPAPTSLPVPTSTNTPAPTSTPAPTAAPVEKLPEPAPQTGQGLTIYEEQPALVEQPAPVEQSAPVETNEKPAPDRAAHHAIAVARLQLPPPARNGLKDAP